jgi:FkbM family methyltransferase
MARIYWVLLRLLAFAFSPQVTYKKLFLHPVGEYISDQIRNRRLHYEIENLMKVRLLSDITYFIDIGANIGNHSNYFKQLGSKVFAFEPAQRNYELLIKNLSSEEAKPFALGDSAKTANLISYPKSMGNSHISGSMEINMGDTETLTEQVQIVKLDDTNLDPQAVTLVKVDAEGFELAILRGGKAFFTISRAKLWLEVHSDQNLAAAGMQYSRREIIDQLALFGFNCFWPLDKTNFLFSKSKAVFWTSIERFPISK